MSKSSSYQHLREYQKQGSKVENNVGGEKQFWKVIAIKKEPRNFWIPTEDCPYLDNRRPLERVRYAVEQGNLIVAQKKLGPFHYELWATEPKLKV